MNRTLRLYLGLLVAVLVSLTGGATGCSGCLQSSGQKGLGIMPGVINDPSNRTLRRSILSYGLGQFCSELIHRGAPLRMRNDQPVMGRFFAKNCSYQELKNGDVFVRFTGVGYVWTNTTWRVGFEATGAVHYNQDFLMDGSTMYAYFRTRSVAETNFRPLMVERGGQIGGGVMRELTAPIARQVLEEHLQRGFTVIRESDGSADFGLGIVEKGQRPSRPYHVRGGKGVTLSNERSEVHGNQLDFLGPFRIENASDSLVIHMSVDGVPAVDVLVVDKDTGDRWLEQYIRQPGVPQPPGQPLRTAVVRIHQPWKQRFKPGKGYYYIVIDNSNRVGTAAPPAVGQGMLSALAAPPAALVSNAVQVED